MKLIEALLSEAPESAKAIIMAGAAGAGKTTLYNSAIKPNLPAGQWEYLNPDTYIEREENPMNLSMASQQVDAKDVPQAMEGKKNFVWDTTASNANRMLGGKIGNRKQPHPGYLNDGNYDFLMVMVYAHPMVSFLRNFSRERKVPKFAVLKTWNSVYGNVGAYSAKLGKNFLMYQSPAGDAEMQKEVDAFEAAYKANKLEEYFADLIEKGGDKFSSSFKSQVPDEDLSPEELEKRQKSRATTQRLFQQEVTQLATNFGKVRDEVDKYLVGSEDEVSSRVKQFVG